MAYSSVLAFLWRSKEKSNRLQKPSLLLWQFLKEICKILIMQKS